MNGNGKMKNKLTGFLTVKNKTTLSPLGSTAPFGSSVLLTPIEFFDAMQLPVTIAVNSSPFRSVA
jgi:hypothetical protein